MCSNTSSGSYGGGELQDDCYFGSCPKKQKKDKVRRRGPGVAELEKIRLQEENKSSSLPIPHSSSSSSLSIPIIDHTLFAPPPPASSFYTTNPVFRPPGTASVNGGCDLVMMPPNFASPMSSYFANGSFPKDLIPPAPVFQRKQHHQTMHLPNPSPGAGGFYQFIEPPSNQRSCVDNVYKFLEEEKRMVSTKRPWPFLTYTTKASVGPAITISRDSKQNRSLDMRLKSPVQDFGTTICNPIAIDSPTSIRRDYPRFIPLSVQYEQQQQQKDFDEKMQWRSKKPFYSFIPSDDRSNGDRQQGACDRYESAGDHGIDLSLKL
ncbi:hypothetical protein EUTSA_v10016947mg [Eutrema salsugineum]|uniref:SPOROCYTELESS-like EAR-containing protein 1 n=1 Tax=Eutrema salsugineum TaxID=72664 RepID=V4M6W6_EUTSA|nr:protein SPEAR2 [Eutrema salsugineum]ESQ51999.1 hypothetical protein EUTSA_v10016947mg [Eutrema salsugineum]